jgi:transposase
MARFEIDLDVPEGVAITGYERLDNGHGIEVCWSLPDHFQCPHCHKDHQAPLEFKAEPMVIRDLQIHDQPSFFVYQVPYARCPHCHYRQDILPPFKRKDTKYTYRFEELVVRMLIGSTEEDVARRLAISAETVAHIVANWIKDGEHKDLSKLTGIQHLGLDEISLKKRHQLYCLVVTDLTDPARPRVLAVLQGKDSAATRKALGRFTEEQRQQIKTYCVDMWGPYHDVCKDMLPNAQRVVDRFHVAKKFNEAIDKQRKQVTAKYKEKLNRAERKDFKTLMWEFRRDPDTLTEEEEAHLEGLFVLLPELRTLHDLRVRFKEIFDTARDRVQAARQLRELRADAAAAGVDLSDFFATYDNHKEGILNYFDERRTSAAVEGLNNKARVITKRAYGIKGADTLWNRLLLDVNHASQAVQFTIQTIRALVAGFKQIFSHQTASLHL